MVEVFHIGIQVLPIVQKYAILIVEGKKETQWFVKEYEVGKNLMLASYYDLVKVKELTKIEDLPDSEKWRLWKLVESWIKERSKEERLDACRVVHLIEQLTQKKIEL
jgi:hypothetical protein